MTDQNNSLDLELEIAEKQAQEAAAQHEVSRQRLQQLRDEQERRLNDPKERAKMFKNANDMIDAGLKEYESKGYSCDVQRDENGLLIKISFKTSKSGSRGPRKTAGQDGFIPAMTRLQFSEIYNNLGNEFKNQNIVDALISKFGENGKYNDFRTQPSLGLILNDGYEGIKIEKVGTKGRNVFYKKIS